MHEDSPSDVQAGSVDEPDAGGDAGKKRTGGGGPFRAFVHMEASGTKMDADSMRDLGRRYRALSQEQRAFYQAIGEAGSSCHRAGLGAFAALSKRAARRQSGHCSEKRTATAEAAEVLLPYFTDMPACDGLPLAAQRSLPAALLPEPIQSF